MNLHTIKNKLPSKLVLASVGAMAFISLVPSSIGEPYKVKEAKAFDIQIVHNFSSSSSSSSQSTLIPVETKNTTVSSSGIKKITASLTSNSIQVLESSQVNIVAKTNCLSTISPKDGVSVDLINDTISYLTGVGMSCQGAVIKVGSLLQESGLNPLAVGDNGTAQGIVQWRGNRFDALKKYCNPWGSRQCQLEFMVQELKDRKQWTPFTTDDTVAIKQAIYSYEGYAHEGQRFVFSKQIWDSIK